MYLGTQATIRHDTDREVLAQLGVAHVSQAPPGDRRDWTTESLSQWRERHARFGIDCEMFHLPLGSRPAFDNGASHVFLGPSAERDREIDQICELLAAASRAGFRGVNYNITILGHLRTRSRTGRGGAVLSSFELDQLDQSKGEFEGGAADADTMWERVAHWLDRIVPVAEEHQIQVACHPQNPTIGDATYRGVARILGDARGFERLVAIRDSAYHGINFCVGTFSESLRQPANEIHDVIRYFGTRGKIFNLHLRNIKGGFGDFVEVFPDDGDVDMLQVLRTLREVG